MRAVIHFQERKATRVGPIVVSRPGRVSGMLEVHDRRESDRPIGIVSFKIRRRRSPREVVIETDR
jgi:hypothetical protein